MAWMVDPSVSKPERMKALRGPCLTVGPKARAHQPAPSWAVVFTRATKKLWSCLVRFPDPSALLCIAGTQCVHS